MSIQVFNELLGVTLSNVVGRAGETQMVFLTEDGRRWKFWHNQDCCENVGIEDVCGDLDDLVGAPLLVAEEVSSEGAAPPVRDYLDSYSWTFYRFATRKGSVTVRWLGESNGCYSESVDAGWAE